jgi:hypothetical protein
MTIQGTEKQVKFAEDILKKIEEKLNNENYLNEEYLEACYITKEDVTSTLENIKKIESAKEIIELRYKNADDLINEFRNINEEIVKNGIETIKKNEKTMKRIKKLKSKTGEEKESYRETIISIISRQLRIQHYKTYEIILEKLIEEVE